MLASLLSLLLSIPLILVWTLGVVLSIRHRETHPAPSLACLIGSGLLAVAVLGGAVLPLLLALLGPQGATMMWLPSVLLALLDAVGVGLLLAAAMLGRA